MARKVILDVDTGTDDAVAIMFAALHPELELLAMTTVNGNVPLANTTDNTLRVLDWIGRPEVPVFAGLSRPIARTGFPTSRHFERDSEDDPHGSALPIPAVRSTPQQRGAVEHLVETLRSTSERGRVRSRFFVCLSEPTGGRCSRGSRTAHRGTHGRHGSAGRPPTFPISPGRTAGEATITR